MIMKILIMTDSRGFCPEKGQNWVSDFKDRNKQYDVESYTWENGATGRITTIFNHLDLIKNNNKKYDLIILQTGIHEYVQIWPIRILRNKLSYFDKNYEQNITLIDKNRYHYRNDSLISWALKELTKHTKSLLFIGSHLRSLESEERVLIMNDIFETDFIDFFNLPMHLAWKQAHCYDQMHYNEDGRKFITTYIERYIERLNCSISDILNQHT